MQQPKLLDVMRRALRADICVHCWKRPPGSESLKPAIPRSCELHCGIFKDLPRLQSIARQVKSPSLAPYQLAVLNRVCQKCDTSPTAGDYCHENLTRSCPLSRYLGEVMQVIEKVQALGSAKQTKNQTESL
jgi:hypothetical protein